MKASTLVEILDAAHQTKYVASPFPERGGIMLVGPPGVMKTSLIESALDEHPNALILSDLNINSLMQMKDDLVSGRYSTIAFTEYEKLYQRAHTTSSNIEGTIKALVQEGFSRASFEDQRMASIKARCLVVGAMTLSFYQKHFNDWSHSGFARRFLWSVIRLEDPEILIEAVHQWKRIPVNGIFRSPSSKSIAYELTPEESNQIGSMVKAQPGQSTPYVLMKKIACVLKWKYGKKPWMQILEDFSESLGKEGAEINDLTLESKKNTTIDRTTKRTGKAARR